MKVYVMSHIVRRDIFACPISHFYLAIIREKIREAVQLESSKSRLRIMEAAWGLRRQQATRDASGNVDGILSLL